jgi:hydrogenase maturation factor
MGVRAGGAWSWAWIAWSPGDAILMSGTIADHGMAVMLQREDEAVDSGRTSRSDAAPLGGFTWTLLGAWRRTSGSCATRRAAGCRAC